MATAAEQAIVSTAPAAMSKNPVWDNTQIEALASLQRVVDEGFVFGAVTGPTNSGKSAIITKLIESSKSKSRVCVHIPTPHQISVKRVEAMEEAIDKVSRQFVNCQMQILIVVDDAHTATRELLTLLNRFASARSSLCSPQIVLAGESDLWDRLDTRYCEKLLRRIALRCSLESSLLDAPLAINRGEVVNLKPDLRRGAIGA